MDNIGCNKERVDMTTHHKLKDWFLGEPEKLMKIDKCIREGNKDEIISFLDVVQTLTEKEKREYYCELYETAYTMVLAGDEVHFRKLLELVPDIVESPMEGINLLGATIEYGRYQMLKALLEYGANSNSVGDVEEGPIGYASYAEHEQKLEMIKLLIQYGSDVASDFPEVIRCCEDDTILEFLYDYLKGSKKDFSCYRSLISAIENDKDVDFVEKILQLGAIDEINHLDDLGWTPLDYVNDQVENSWRENTLQVKELLEKNGAVPGDESVKKILDLSSNLGSYLRNNSEKDKKDSLLKQIMEIKNLKECFIKACHLNGTYEYCGDLVCRLLYYGEVSVVKVILEKIGDYTWLSENVYEAPGTYLKSWTEKEWEQYFWLIQKFVSENVPMNQNPLFSLCERSRSETKFYSWKAKEIITNLLDLYIGIGAEINEERDKLYGYSPLATAIFNKNLLCVSYLLSMGAKIEKHKKQPMSFQLFSVYPSDLLEEERVLYFKLKEYGLDIDEVNEIGDTVLHKFCQMGKLEKVKLIVECGARIDVKNQKGQIPAETAKENGHFEIYEYLIEKGDTKNE